MTEMDMGLAPKGNKNKKKSPKKQGFWKNLRNSLFPRKGDSTAEIMRKIVFLTALVVLVCAVVILILWFTKNFGGHDNYVDENGSQTATPAHLVELKNRAPTTQEIEQLPTGAINDEYAALYAQNSDFIGWLNIPGTNVDYPVMQTDDNDFYLHRNFDKQEVFEGTLFADYRGKITSEGMPQNTVIYGHNMLLKYQFSALQNYKNDIEFLKMSPVVEFNTLYGNAKYKIISVFLVNWLPKDGEVFKYNSTNYFKNQSEFFDFVVECMDRSLYETGVDIEYGDEFLTLSTCDKSTYMDLRLVVVARKVRENENPNVDTSKIVKKDSVKYFEGYYDIYSGYGGKDYFWHGRTWDTSIVKGLDSYLKENGLVDSPDDY
ncbi:MAG: class B sortase [Oscillospiraceae bacterium]